MCYVVIVVSYCTPLSLVVEKGHEQAFNRVLHLLHLRPEDYALSTDSRSNDDAAILSLDEAWQDAIGSTGTRNGNKRTFADEDRNLFDVDDAATIQETSSRTKTSKMAAKRWGDTLSACIFAYCMPRGHIHLECVLHLCQRSALVAGDVKRSGNRGR